MEKIKTLLEYLKIKSILNTLERDETIEEFIANCERGDWLMRLAYSLEIDNRKLILAKGLCAQTISEMLLDKRSIYAIDTAINFGNHLVDEQELKNAALLAYSAYRDAEFEYRKDADFFGGAGSAHLAFYSTAVAAAASTVDSKIWIKNGTYSDDIEANYVLVLQSTTADLTAEAVALDAIVPGVNDDSFINIARKANLERTAEICRNQIGQLLINAARCFN